MIEYIINILEYYGLTADKIGPAVFVGLGGWFLYKSLRNQIWGLEEDIGKLEKDLKEDIKDLDGDIGKLDKKVSFIDNRVSYIEGNLKINYTKSASPTVLTDRGTNVLIESKAKEIVDANKRKILDEILADPKPTNAYDAQEKTRKIIEDMEDDPIFLPIKDYAFKKGINLYAVLGIISVYFRDFVLEELGFKDEDCEGDK